MKPLKRTPVQKHKSAKQFKKDVGTTAAANLRGTPMRGGFRF